MNAAMHTKCGFHPQWSKNQARVSLFETHVYISMYMHVQPHSLLLYMHVYIQCLYERMAVLTGTSTQSNMSHPHSWPVAAGGFYRL